MKDQLGFTKLLEPLFKDQSYCAKPLSFFPKQRHLLSILTHRTCFFPFYLLLWVGAGAAGIKGNEAENNPANELTSLGWHRKFLKCFDIVKLKALKNQKS